MKKILPLLICIIFIFSCGNHDNEKTIFILDLSNESLLKSSPLEGVDDESDSLINLSSTILKSRLDRYIYENKSSYFGGNLPNLNRGEVSNQIIIDFPLAFTDLEIARIKDLIECKGKIEFWETYNFSEIYDDFLNAFESSPEFSSLISKGFFIPNITSEGTISESPVIGDIHVEAKDLFDSLINEDYFLNLWDKDLYLAYGAKNHNSMGEDFHPVLALKMNGIEGYRLDGSVISYASVTRSEYDPSQIVINLEMLAPGKNGERKWFDITEDNVGRSVAVVLDGEVKTFPNINEPISGGRSQISGVFSLQEARDIANVLSLGELPLDVKVSDYIIKK